MLRSEREHRRGFESVRRGGETGRTDGGLVSVRHGGQTERSHQFQCQFSSVQTSSSVSSVQFGQTRQVSSRVIDTARKVAGRGLSKWLNS